MLKKYNTKHTNKKSCYILLCGELSDSVKKQYFDNEIRFWPFENQGAPKAFIIKLVESVNATECGELITENI